VTDLLLVAVGGGAGALLRWGLTLLGRGPWPTVAANVAGSALLGVVAGTGPPWAVTLLGAGVAGALTTYSTFALEALTIPLRTAIVYVVTTLLTGGLALGLGLLISSVA
jgi:CrcB protein